jgi:hypothetical protein
MSQSRIQQIEQHRKATAPQRAASFNREAAKINAILGTSFQLHNSKNKPSGRVAL